MRAPDAKVWIPTQDEWYKAAYYDPSIGAADDRDNYWLYPSRQNVLGNNNIPDGAANYRSDDYSTTPGNNVYSAATQYLTDGGTFIDSGSYYGTFDQGGNVSEWNDEVVSASSQRNRGGNWDSNGFGQQSTARSFNQPTFESELLGFRIAGVPEPTSGLLVMLGSLLACARRRR
jgi:formylglycine-generating enzyme required for sulfatase activity